MKIKITSKSLIETQKIAGKFALAWKPPLVISLIGDLGSGKTVFAKGFAKALGIKKNVTSPTFTILNDYENNPPLFHFDMYRLKNKEEAYELGFDEYFDLTKLKGFCIVEWACNVYDLLPERHMEIEFIKKSKTERELIIEMKGII
ncbi:MAG: tRNA (adenosine(37)-N6)-threonylcarbamoyltransferase complex ATPase subunit type 1 TsaE [Clostridia bacterium]